MDSFGQIKLEQLKAALRPHGVCVTDDQLAGFLDDSLRPRDAAWVESHLESCARCATELSLLREFRSAAPSPEEAASVRSITRQLAALFSEILGTRRRGLTLEMVRHGSRTFWRRYVVSPQSLALASMALVLAAVVSYQYRPEPPSLPQDLGTRPPILRSQKLEIASPQGELSEAPLELNWQPAPGAVAYEVRLMEVDGTEVWKAGSTGTSLALPDEIRSRMVPGRIWLWQVVARNVSGGEIAASDRVRIRLATPSRSRGS